LKDLSLILGGEIIFFGHICRRVVNIVYFP
jgi:hypothetical protein